MLGTTGPLSLQNQMVIILIKVNRYTFMEAYETFLLLTPFFSIYVNYGWMNCEFSSFSTVLQHIRIMGESKGRVQWNPVHDWKVKIYTSENQTGTTISGRTLSRSDSIRPFLGSGSVFISILDINYQSVKN